MEKAIVFDCQDMPEKLRRKYFDKTEAPNDVYVEWYWTDFYTVYEGEEPYKPYPSELVDKEIQDWMLVNGLTLEMVEEDTTILVKHWW